jgi:putative ABC transport system ATP-binding protein
MKMDKLIELDGICKSYRLGENTVPALKRIDLSVQSGEFIALQGPSGSGKSTLLNLCGLLDQANDGQHRLSGIDIKSLPQRRLTELRRKQIGFVFQGFNLIPVMSVFENVEYPLLLTDMSAKTRRQQVREMLARVGLGALQRHRPDQLSGGQRQRVAVARALVKRPGLVIADEPTANLDSETAATVIDLMHEMANESGCTFLIATHDERMASRCGRTLQLRDGVLL